MKGVIPDCFGKLIVSKYGKDKWEQCLEGAGLKKNTPFLPTSDIPDADVLNVVQSACKVLNISLQEVADGFGDFWVNDYARKIYKAYFKKAGSAREFLLNMDNLHNEVTKNIPNAHPPRFTFDWANDKTLIMTYKSDRGMIDFLVGLVKGVGKFFNEDLQVKKVGNDKVQIIF